MHMLYNHDHAVTITLAIEALALAITGERIGHPQDASTGTYAVWKEIIYGLSLVNIK